LIGESSWPQRAAGALRTKLHQASSRVLGGEPGGLLPGLVVGDTSGLTPELSADSKTTGLTHLTAVSGSNVCLTVLR